MNKIIKLIPVFIVTFIFNLSCSSNDDSGSGAPEPTPNTAPTAVGQLTFPSSDLLCIDNNVNFQWSPSTDANGDVVRYRLTIAFDRDLTNIAEQRNNVSTNNISVTLQPGTAYYWNVVATDGQDDAAPSATFAFYTEGNGVSNYAPFTATLNSPVLEASLTAGMTTLDWTGSDVDPADTLTYDLYFGETTTPALLQTDVATSTFDVNTVAATTYYWRVDTKDNNGVKAIGQVWTFSTN